MDKDVKYDKASKVTEEDIQNILDDIIIGDTGIPVKYMTTTYLGGGLYKTGDCYHGEEFLNNLNAAMKENIKEQIKKAKDDTKS